MKKHLTVALFVNASKTTRIQGYDEAQAEMKESWLKAGHMILRILAKHLELPKGSYDIRINRAGPAVSGEVTLHGTDIYVCLEQGACGGDSFYWRTCNGRQDFTGRQNRWQKWESLLDLDKLSWVMTHQIAMDLSRRETV